MRPKRWQLVGGAIVLVVAVLAFTLRDASVFCGDIEELVAESATGFEDVRGELLSRSTGEWSTSFAIEGSTDCKIFVDPERASHVCDWEYASEEEAASDHTRLVQQVPECLGLDATVQSDASVNHPDFWASSYFATETGEVSVSLKNKSALGKVFVSVQVDGLTP